MSVTSGVAQCSGDPLSNFGQRQRVVPGEQQPHPEAADGATVAEPLGTAVDAAIVSVNLLCQIQTNRDVPIKNADLLGAVVPR